MADRKKDDVAIRKVVHDTAMKFRKTLIETLRQLQSGAANWHSGILVMLGNKETLGNETKLNEEWHQRLLCDIWFDHSS